MSSGGLRMVAAELISIVLCLILEEVEQLVSFIASINLD